MGETEPPDPPKKRGSIRKETSVAEWMKLGRKGGKTVSQNVLETNFLKRLAKMQGDKTKRPVVG